MLLDIVNTSGETIESAMAPVALAISVEAPAPVELVHFAEAPVPVDLERLADVPVSVDLEPDAPAEGAQSDLEAFADAPPVDLEPLAEALAPDCGASERDHVEIASAGNFAAVSDRGLRHSDNQDSVSLVTVEILVSPIDIPPVYIAVVCDGVSSCESGASASAVAAQAASDSLKQAYTRNPSANARVELQTAIRRANDAVCAIPCDPGSEKDPPSTTVIAAVVQDGAATIGWVGDSRAYWVDEEDAGVLTRDDSWINAMLDAGYMTEAEALVSPNQSALYRCLGGETCEDGPSADPTFSTYFMRPGTRLILCSDGFWNYARTPADVARVVRQTPHDDALRTAKHLVNFAIVGGGHDNITAAVLSL
jgi:PPM family protein phosphatase